MILWNNKFFFLTLPLVSSLMLILSFPSANQAYLVWVSLLPLFFYCQSLSWKKAFWGGFLTGSVFFFYLLAYLVLGLDFVLPRSYGVLAVIISSFYSAFFFGIFTLLVSLFIKNINVVVSIFAIPSSWVLLEYLRSLGLLGHTGGSLGFSQSSYPLLLQNIALYGYWGLPFLIVMFQVIIFFLVLSLIQKNFNIYRRSIIVGTFIFILLLGGGIIIPQLFPIEKREEALRIVLIQGNIPQEDVLEPAKSRGNFQKYLDLTREAYNKYEPLDLIVWPETVLSTNVSRNFPAAEAEIARLSEEMGAPIFLGAMYEEKKLGHVYNSIFFQRPGYASRDDYRYDKVRLVPFAEYFPNPALLNNILALDIPPGTYTPGNNPQGFKVNDFYFGGIVCFESYFPYPSIELVQQGIEHLFVLTNDAWFLDSNGLAQHAQAAAIRAVENGLGVTQVANTGYTVSYDFRGREILNLPLQQDGFALLETKFPHRQTLYLLWGNYFLYLNLILLVAGLWCKNIKLN